MTLAPFTDKYPDIFWDIQTIQRYLDNLGIFRNIYFFFAILISILETIHFSKFHLANVAHITKNGKASIFQSGGLLEIQFSTTARNCII